MQVLASLEFTHLHPDQARDTNHSLNLNLVTRNGQNHVCVYVYAVYAYMTVYFMKSLQELPYKLRFYFLYMVLADPNCYTLAIWVQLHFCAYARISPHIP